ncbi:MAG TPA: nucleotidyltransferase domain-containing protein [Desulfuromonadales bacterium]|nr:nucleotidyltransferase domain-containing protein [Desulfuromonadales bacterium]
MINETRRIYGKVKEIPFEELVEAFRCLEEIRVAVLFGSRAAGLAPTSLVRSDYDFAVLLDKAESSGWGHLANARVAIGQRLKLPDSDFDLVDLDVADPNLKKSIGEKFLILKGDPDDVLRLLG